MQSGARRVRPGDGAVAVDAAIRLREAGELMYDVVIVGGGFAGVTAARECALRGRKRAAARGPRPARRTDLEHGVGRDPDRARRRLGPLASAAHVLRADPRRAAGSVRTRRRAGRLVRRSAAASAARSRSATRSRAAAGTRSWRASARRCRCRTRRCMRCPSWRALIGSRSPSVSISSSSTDEERAVLSAELESLAHAPLDQAGAVAVLRWHALSGYSLELTQETGGRVDDRRRHRRTAERDRDRGAVRGPARFAGRRGRAPQRPRRGDDSRRRGIRGAGGGVAVPLNALGAIEFTPELRRGQARARSRSVRPRVGSS